MKKRLLSILLALALCLTLLPTVALAAEGDVDYLYCDASGANWQTGTKAASDYTLVTSSDTGWGTSGATTWYVVTGEVTIGTAEAPQRVTVTGDVHLILTDGCTLTVNGGIQVQDNDNDPSTPSTNALTIYGQSVPVLEADGTVAESNTTGKLTAQGVENDNNAAIGGNTGGGDGGTITINGGVVEAIGKYGAGIGGGCGDSTGGNGGAITINGGFVKAESISGAGIGGGDGNRGGDGGIVTINGGTVTATSTQCAGIGGGFGFVSSGSGGTLIITGGSVAARDKATAGIKPNDNYLEVFGGLTLPVDLTIPEGKTLTIPSGTSLTIPEGKTLTIPEGVTLTNNSSIYVDGTLSGTVSGDGPVYYPLTLKYCTADTVNTSTYNNKTYGQAGSTITLTHVDPPKGLTFAQWNVSPSDYAIETNSFTMPSAALTVTAQYRWTSGSAVDVEVSSEDQLRLALDSGATEIKLMNDITTLKAQLEWQDKKITLDLNGHVLGNSGYQTITLTDTSAGGDTSLTLIDSNPNKSNTVGGNEYKGGVLWGKITLTVSGGGPRNCCLYANGGSVTGDVGLNSAGSSIYCTSNTPTVFYGTVGRWGEIHGGIFRGPKANGNIYGGIFYNQPINTDTDQNFKGQIYGGIFYGTNTIARIAGKTVTFKYNGSTYAREVVESGNAAVAPIPPQATNTETGYHINWYKVNKGDSSIADVSYDFSTPVTEDITLTAVWTPNVYDVTLITNGGTIQEGDVTEYTYGVGAKLPVMVTRSGFSFAGWYDNAYCVGRPVTEITTTDIGNKTFYAAWTYIPTYPPIVNQPEKGGSVTVSPSYPIAGSKVTITPTPENGYEVGQVIVTDKDGKPVAVKDNGDGTYTFTQPAGKVTVTVTFQRKAQISFVDVPTNSYYYDAVYWAVANGITTGTGDGTTFSPDAACTRAQAVTFLWRAAGSPEPETVSSFADVPADSYYAKAVAWAVENGITNGTGDSTFSPDATCTRAQIVTFLWRAQGSSAAGSANPFKDVAADDYYNNAVLWAVKNDITTGTSATTFTPDADCTRAQIVTFLYRCLGK